MSLVVVAHNDRPTIGGLLERSRSLLVNSGESHEIVVVDGGSTDGTAEAALAAGAVVLQRQGPDYAGALRDALSVTRGNWIVTIDGDQSQEPVIIEELLAHRRDADMVIASRYARFGHADMHWLRRAVSRWANRLSAFLLDVPLSDLTSSFRLYRRDALSCVDLGTGDAALLQIVVGMYMEGYRIAEVPFHYHPVKARCAHLQWPRIAASFARALLRSYRLRNSIASADYDFRAFHSRHPFQRYWQRKRYALIRGFVEDYQCGVDVGCGSSVILDALPRVIGVDYSHQKLRFLSGHTQRSLARADLRALPFEDGAFDLLICSQVIEHVPADPRIFAEFRRLVRPGGVLILGTPDYARTAWLAIEWLYKRLAPGGYGDEHITHYCFTDLVRLLCEHGFELCDHRYICGGELILKARRTFPGETP